MIDRLIPAGLSNTGFALLLALVALAVGTWARRPHLAHWLWLWVLIKLLTPPLVAIPVDFFPYSVETVSGTASRPAVENGATIAHEGFLGAGALHLWRRATPWLVTGWLAGSALVLAVSFLRVWRFNRLLRAHREPPPRELLTTAASIARRLQLKSVPRICTTTANVAPMVCWTGGPIRVLIPALLLERLPRRAWRWVLAHELAHVRRGDHWVRWLEWLARVVFWWNPLVWWAQRHLRAMEEICCDALVITALEPAPRTYAVSILTAIESLAQPMLRPPAMASEINSGGFLERRFNMMISNQLQPANSTYLWPFTLLCALAILPLGVVHAQDYEAVGKRLRAAVKADEISGAQARVMLGALRRAEADDETVQKERARNEYAALADQLKALAAKEEVSAEDARLRREALRRVAAAGGDGQSERHFKDWDAIEAKVEAAVERGELTREEADTKYRKIKKGLKKKRGAEQRRRRELGLRREEYDKATGELRAAVAAGELSVAEARARFLAVRQLMGDHVVPSETPEANDTASARESLERYLKRALELGLLTRAEAEAKYRGLRKRMPREEEADGLNWSAITKRIEGAVARGALTREEADAAYSALKK